MSARRTRPARNGVGGAKSARTPDAKSVSITRPTAVVVVLALAVAWLLLTVVDLRDADGAASMMGMFGIPMIASAIVIQLWMSAVTAVRLERPMRTLEEMPGAPRVRRSFLWWIGGVLPAGILAGSCVAVVREPDYFLSDGPWMLIWIPVFVALAMLLGALVWFFVVFPIALLVKAVRATVRGEGTAGMYVWPVVLLLLAALCIVGGLSTDFAAVGKAAAVPVVATILGLPGEYEVIWEPGLWIVRGIVAVLLLFLIGSALADRSSRSRR